MVTKTSKKTIAHRTAKAKPLLRADMLATLGVSLVKTRTCLMLSDWDAAEAPNLRARYFEVTGSFTLRIDLYRYEGDGRTCWIKVAYHEGGRDDGKQDESAEVFHTRAEALGRWMSEPNTHDFAGLAIPAILAGR